MPFIGILVHFEVDILMRFLRFWIFFLNSPWGILVNSVFIVLERISYFYDYFLTLYNTNVLNVDLVRAWKSPCLFENSIIFSFIKMLSSHILHCVYCFYSFALKLQNICQTFWKSWLIKKDAKPVFRTKYIQRIWYPIHFYICCIEKFF